MALASGSPQREATKEEVEYAGVARDAGAPELCNKIYPKATQGWGFNRPGYQIQYTRSSCFFDVAVRTEKKELCDQVIPLSTFDLLGGADGSKISKTNCEKEVDKKKLATESDEGFTPYASLLSYHRFLEQMGYTEKMISPSQKIARSEEDMWLNFYESMALTPDFRKRLSTLFDYSAVRTPVVVIKCEKPNIEAKSRYYPYGKECCLDFNSNERCDRDEEISLTFNDLELEFSKGSPPAIVCESKPFKFQVHLRNITNKKINVGDGWIEIVGVNPVLLGQHTANFTKPLPEIPPGTTVDVIFPGLKYEGATRNGAHNWLGVRALLCIKESCAKFTGTTVDVKADSSVDCKGS